LRGIRSAVLREGSLEGVEVIRRSARFLHGMDRELACMTMKKGVSRVSNHHVMGKGKRLFEYAWKGRMGFSAAFSGIFWHLVHRLNR
jgi:hypothetical protein